MINENDVKLIRQFQKSPIFFIKKIWGLTPQPLKPAYKKIAKSSPLQEYKAEWFGEFVKGKHITWQQWVILLAVEKALLGEAPKRISVKSGHGIGKDATLSWLILWFLFCFKDSQLPCTAPTSQQMYDILWKEIAIWLNRMPAEIRNLYEWQTTHIRIKERPETWFARAQTARKENTEALAGVHGEHVFLIADEASGVHDAIYSTAEGALTGEEFFFVMVSNPTRGEGYFYDSHNKDARNWQTFTFNSADSPIVDWGFVDRIIKKYGKDSDEYRIRVAGLFPKAGAMDKSGYVPLLTQNDIHMGPDVPFVGKKRMGIDPSGGGQNKTEWVVRDNFRAKVAATEPISTPKSVAQRTLTLFDFYELKAQDAWLDNFGEGANVSQEIALAEVEDDKKRINAVNFNDKPDDDRFLNKRAEAYWRVREWCRQGGEICNEELRDQLLTIKYRRELSGKIKIMSKEEMAREGIPSPDKADGLALTFYEKEAPRRKRFKQPKYQDPFEGEGD